ncbi:MAG: glycoside hydrolase family 78 protein [Bacteroidales bacterium]|nr:glycoside hydrolase family 78 protein [Bacteroidales bacterium]
MKRIVVILLLVLSATTCFAQQFIGCREGDGWAETPMLRKTFTLKRSDFKHADFQQLAFSVDVASLGYHEVYVNDTKVGDRVMQPAVSQLDKRALWVSYDITPYIHEGDNELLLWLGQGWGRIYGTPAVAQAFVEKTVSDGECGLIYTILATDSTWEASPSPYSYTGSWQPMQFGGERYDARVKESWRRATVYHAEGSDSGSFNFYSSENISLRKQEFAGNIIVGALPPQRVDTLPDGTFLLDFGRVVTGWFQLQCLPIPEGDEIAMEYLDHLEAKPPFTETDIYVSDGTGDDDIHFTNRFHMHSFRYVKVKGLSHYLTYGLDIPILMANAVQISAVDPYGGATFECSDPRLNAIHDMVKYTLSCLTFSGYMVDCPHIERMGYGGDGNSSTMTLQTLWDVRSTYANWMQAWADAMQPDGDLPYVAPAFRTGGGPYWQGFVVKAPWRTYLNYGDRTLIYRHYDDMKRWLEYVEHHSEDYILQPWPDNERHSWFLGDWAVPEGVGKGGESVLHASSCFISDCLSDMIQMAKLIGHPGDAQHYAEWRRNLNASIHRHFYHPETHTYANGTPLDQCYALLMGIPPDSATAAAVKAQLVKDCHIKYRDHIAAGLMGVPIFTEWCIREKETDLMATILRQPDYPGYLNMMDKECVNALTRQCVSADAENTNTLTQSHNNALNNAFTTWESWDCGRPGKEDRSRVHNCYNGIGIWFYQALAGIRHDIAAPGYKHFYIDPQPCEGITWVKATKPTPYGDISVEIEGQRLKITIPPGTSATLFPHTPHEQSLGEGHHELKIKL